MGVTLSLAGTLFLLISISYAAAMLFSGFLAARIGHGMTIVSALACITLGLLVCAVAPGIAILALGMLLIGAGAGAYPPSGMVMINTKISLRRRSTALSFHEIGPNLALLLCPLMVLILEPWFGWRGVLFWMALVCGFATVSFWRWGTIDSGIGAAPDFGTIRTILRLRSTWVGIVILSAALSGLHGVYAILPAYLVTEYSLSPQYVNFLLTVSRIAGLSAASSHRVDHTTFWQEANDCRRTHLFQFFYRPDRDCPGQLGIDCGHCPAGPYRRDDSGPPLRACRYR